MSDLTEAIYIMAYVAVIGLTGLTVSGIISTVDGIQTVLLVALVMTFWNIYRKKEQE